MVDPSFGQINSDSNSESCPDLAFSIGMERMKLNWNKHDGLTLAGLGIMSDGLESGLSTCRVVMCVFGFACYQSITVFVFVDQVYC